MPPEVFRHISAGRLDALLGAPRTTVDAALEGKLLTVKVNKSWDVAPPEVPRGAIKGFSAAARRRMLRLIARIDWQAIANSLFVTLTYPDARVDHLYETRTAQRWAFLKRVELHLQRPVASLWRTEWVPRQSGTHEGQLAPHLHMVVFGVRWIDKADINRWWGEIIDYGDPVHTRVDACEDDLGALYATKYAAKSEVLSGLANSAYLAGQVGRSWGVTRRALIPMAPRREVTELTEEAVATAMRIAGEVLGLHYLGSFFLLGDTAPGYFQEIAKIGSTPMVDETTR